MKKFLSILLICTLILGISVTTFGASEDVPDYIRVGITTGNGTYNLSFTTGFQIYEYNNGNAEAVQDFSYINDIQVVNDGSFVNIYNLTDLSTPIYSYDNESDFFIGSSDLENGFFWLNSVQYRGGMKFYKSSDSENRVINVISFEKYLYGVVSKEMSSSYPLEALKAQAVAARSYALGNVGRHASLGYDICNTQCCQVYGGVSSEIAKCSSAVDATDGVIAYYNGTPISCYYSANNGGYMESSENIWGTYVGYLQVKKDDYNPEYTWTATFTPEKLSSTLKSAGYNVGTIVAVNVLERTDAESVTKLEVVGTDGTAVLTKEKIRTILGTSTVKSLKFTVSCGTSTETTTTETGSKYYVKGVTGTATEKILTGLAMFDSKGKTITINSSAVIARSSSKVTSLSGVVTTQTTSKTVATGDIVFTGKGYGHGIGMSQTGAKTMAEQGFTYDDILKYYYVGITLE